MKNTSLFYLIILIISLDSSGQEFAPIGTLWYYTRTHSFSGNIDYIRLESIKDTIINGIHCRKIAKNRSLMCNSRPDIEFMYENDSAEVLFYDANLDTFQIIWDFNAKIGDSWNILISLDSYVIDTVRYSVDSISSLTINESVKKVLHITCQSSGIFELLPYSKIIEDIGDTIYFFPWYLACCDGDYASGLRCYEDSIIGLYSTGLADSCDYTYIQSGLNDNTDFNNIQIFPNPTSGSLNITAKDEYYGLEIYDSIGRKIFADEFFTSIHLYLMNLNKGLYFLVLKNKYHQIRTAIIQKY